MPSEIVELLEEASLLHDAGKIGIPDAILLKPGKLTDEEYETMRQHCAFGRRIIQQSPDSVWERYGTRSQLDLIDPANATAWLIPVAATIAQTHHEHWDGTGYPLGLREEQIPIEGRITAVADCLRRAQLKTPLQGRLLSREVCRDPGTGTRNSLRPESPRCLPSPLRCHLASTDRSGRRRLMVTPSGNRRAALDPGATASGCSAVGSAVTYSRERNCFGGEGAAA